MTIIDRRSNGTRSAANQERLQRRLRARLKDAVETMARSGSLKDLAEGEHRIRVPTRDLKEPSFHHSREGSWERVLPGNKEFQTGDQIQKPEGGAVSSGREGAPDGLGNDEISVLLSASEFMDLLFDGLSLPRLCKTAQGDVNAEQSRRAGFIKDGSPSRMHVGRTMRAARSRRLALRAGKNRELQALEEEQKELQKWMTENQDSTTQKNQKIIEQRKKTEERLQWIGEKITVLRRKIKAVPFIDESDLRFAHLDQQPMPMTNAVMFCVMDVSGSMGETEKDLSKRFFLLLYLFLQRHYTAVQIVFIKHHSEASECSEEAFFGAQEGGGTLISPAIILTEEIIAERFPADRWNVYVAQSSDGDNYFADNAVVSERLTNLLPRLRGYFFLEVNRQLESALFQVYENLSHAFPWMKAVRASIREEIYPLFRDLFAHGENL